MEENNVADKEDGVSKCGNKCDRSDSNNNESDVPNKEEVDCEKLVESLLDLKVRI